MNILTNPHKERRFSITPQPMPDLAEFMTTEEAAEVLGFTVASVRQLVYKKKLDSIRVGRAILIPKNVVRDYKEKTAGMSKNDPRRNLK